MKKIQKLTAKRERLLDELDEVARQIKLRHIEYSYLCELQAILAKLKN